MRLQVASGLFSESLQQVSGEASAIPQTGDERALLLQIVRAEQRLHRGPKNVATVLPPANGGGEAVVVSDPDAPRRGFVWSEEYAAQLGIDGNLARRRR